jgi:hypothetical protein
VLKEEAWGYRKRISIALVVEVEEEKEKEAPCFHRELTSIALYPREGWRQ